MHLFFQIVFWIWLAVFSIRSIGSQIALSQHKAKQEEFNLRVSIMLLQICKLLDEGDR